MLCAPFRQGAWRARGRRAGGVSPLEGGGSLLRSVTAGVGRASAPAHVRRGAAASQGTRPATQPGDDAHPEAGRGHGAIGSLAPGAYAAPEGEVAETASPACRPARLRRVREFLTLAGPVAPPRRPISQPGRVCRGSGARVSLRPGAAGHKLGDGGREGPTGLGGLDPCVGGGPGGHRLLRLILRDVELAEGPGLAVFCGGGVYFSSPQVRRGGDLAATGRVFAGPLSYLLRTLVCPWLGKLICVVHSSLQPFLFRGFYGKLMLKGG